MQGWEAEKDEGLDIGGSCSRRVDVRGWAAAAERLRSGSRDWEDDKLRPRANYVHEQRVAMVAGGEKWLSSGSRDWTMKMEKTSADGRVRAGREACMGENETWMKKLDKEEIAA